MGLSAERIRIRDPRSHAQLAMDASRATFQDYTALVADT